VELRAGYKLTEIGIIPVDWDVVSLGELATIKDGTHQTPKYVASGIPFFSVEHVTSNNFKETKFISEQEHRFLTRNSKIEKGDILMTRIGSIGVCKLIDWDVEASYYVSLALLKIRAGCSAAYIAHYSNSAAFQQEVELHSLASAIPKKINLGPISDVKVAIPPRAEQNAIASALSDVDALLAGLDRLIAKKRDLKQAAMQQLLTGHTRFPGFKGEWKTTLLRQAVATPITDGPHLTPRFLQTGIPFLSVNNLVSNRLDFSTLRYISREDHAEFSKKCKPRRGDILFGKAASVGMVALIDTDIELNIWSPLALIRVAERMHERFVFYALQTSAIARQIKLMTNASSQGNIGMGDIGMLEIPIPSRAEQEAIAKVLSDMDEELTTLEARRDKTRAVKQGMMQELLTGKTRLV